MKVIRIDKQDKFAIIEVVLVELKIGRLVNHLKVEEGLNLNENYSPMTLLVVMLLLTTPT